MPLAHEAEILQLVRLVGRHYVPHADQPQVAKIQSQFLQTLAFATTSFIEYKGMLVECSSPKFLQKIKLISRRSNLVGFISDLWDAKFFTAKKLLVEPGSHEHWLGFVDDVTIDPERST